MALEGNLSVIKRQKTNIIHIPTQQLNIPLQMSVVMLIQSIWSVKALGQPTMNLHAVKSI